MLTRMDNFLRQQAQARAGEKRLGDALEAKLVEMVGRENVAVIHDSIVVDVQVKDGKILFERG